MCSKCTKLIPELKQFLRLEQRQDDLEEQVNTINNNQDNHDTRLTKCEVDLQELTEKFQNLETTRKDELEAQRLHYQEEYPSLTAENAWKKSPANLASIVRTEISERDRIEKLKDNLVISGIEEKGTEEADKQEVIRLVDQELGIQMQISNTERIGKLYEPKDGEVRRPRLLRLKFTDKLCRKNVLTNAITLRNSESQDVKDKIFIRPDLTKNQREEQKNLRDLLRKIRKDNPNKKYKIIRNQVKEILPSTGIQNQPPAPPQVTTEETD